MDLDQYRQLALAKHKGHQKFLRRLAKKPPKNLDLFTQKIHNRVFSQIDCKLCANCCKTLGPLWTEVDIMRVAKHLHLKLADFETKYLRVDEEGDKVFRTMPCPFLGPDNLCNIYHIRPKACREFPHTDRKKIYQINHLTLKNTLTCPAAYEFVEELKGQLDSSDFMV